MEDHYGCERTDRANKTGRDAPFDAVAVMTNLLLPFTHGIDVSAITYALAFAQRFHSALVVLSLISLPETPGTRKPRLEAIQQSKDFLEFVIQKEYLQGEQMRRLTNQFPQIYAVKNIFQDVRGQELIEKILPQLERTWSLTNS